MKKLSFVLALALACSMTLTACGNSSAPEAPKPEANAPAAPSTEATTTDWVLRGNCALCD